MAGRTVLLGSAIAVLIVASCGPAPQAPPPHSAAVDRDPRCAGFELDVQRVWNDEAKAEIRTAFGATGLGYASKMSEKVITMMDDITRDWVMLKENLCTDCLVRELVSKEIYPAISLCYDSALIRQRTAVSLFKAADAATVENALNAFADISDRLESCQREAVYASYGSDARSEDQEAVRRAEEKTAEASVALALGKNDQAARAAEEAAAAAEKANSKRLRAEALIKEGMTAREYARYDEARGKFDRALSISEEIGDDLGRAEALNQIGWLLDDLKEHEDALAHYRQAERLYLSTVGDDSTEYSAVLGNIGNALSGLDRYEEAIEHLERALVIDRKVFGDEHPSTARTLNNLGLAWYEFADDERAGLHSSSLDDPVLGYYEKALGYYMQARETFRSVYGDEHPDYAKNLVCIGTLSDSLGDYETALKYYEPALETFRSAYGDENLTVTNTLNYIGAALYKLGKYEKALEAFEQALSIDEKIYPEGHPDLAIDQGWVDDCKKKLGR